MNDNVANDVIDRPVTLGNEAIPDAAIFAVAAPAATVAAAADIAPDAHFLLSELKLDTEILSKVNIKNMDVKDTIDTTPVPDSPDADTPDAAAQDTGSTDSIFSYLLRNRKFAPYSTNIMKIQKKEENKINDKVTINNPPDPKAPVADTPNASAQDAGSTDSYLPYSLRNHKFASYSTNTMKNQKKKETKIDDKVTIDTPPVPDVTGADIPNASSQYAGPTESNSPYSFRNCKFAPHSTTTMKNQKKNEKKLMINTHLTPPLPPTHPTLIPPMLHPKMLALQTPISHIHR